MYCIAEMAASCCTSRIFALKLGFLFNALFLSYLWDYHHHSYNSLLMVLDSLSYIFVADSSPVGLIYSTILYVTL